MSSSFKTSSCSLFNISIPLRPTCFLVTCHTIIFASYCCCNTSPQTQRHNTTHIHYHMLLEVKVQTGSPWRTPGGWQGWVPSGGTRGESVSLPCPDSRGCPDSLAPAPGHLHSRQQRQLKSSSGWVPPTSSATITSLL